MKSTYYKIKKNYLNFFNLKSSTYPHNSEYPFTQVLLARYGNGSFYCNLIKSINENKKIKTDVEIKLIGNKILNKITLEDIINNHGIHSHQITMNDLLGINIVTYKQRIGIFKVNIDFHFFKNNLFFYNYIFTNLNATNKNEIIRILENKYLDKNLFNIKDNYIIDVNENIILLDDSVNFSISYLCDKKIVTEKIMKHINFVKKKKEQKDYLKTLFNKL